MPATSTCQDPLKNAETDCYLRIYYSTIIIIITTTTTTIIINVW